jgi:hypothetical protein
MYIDIQKELLVMIRNARKCKSYYVTHHQTQSQGDPGNGQKKISKTKKARTDASMVPSETLVPSVL